MQRRLSVSVLVTEWHKSRSDNRQPDDLLLCVLEAFWTGELELYAPNSDQSTSRQMFLIGLREISPGSGIAFYESSAPYLLTELDSGEFIVELGTQIVLPAKIEHWKPEILSRACATLATAPIRHYPVDFLIPFKIHEVDREEFGALCDKRGWEKPSFWFSPGERKRFVSGETQCRAWLATEASGPKRKSKQKYFEEAKRRFRVSRRKFDQIWDATVPLGWKWRGRPKKTERGEQFTRRK